MTTIADTISQLNQQKKWFQLIEHERLPHAMLVHAPEGAGGLQFALELAQYISCQQKTANQACNNCASCNKTRQHIHPDIHFSFPVIGSKKTAVDFIKEWRVAMSDNPYLSLQDWLEQIGGDGKNANINKQECLEIYRRLGMKGFESASKVQIIWMAEYLGREGNRLLKLIEEPPEDTYILIIAEDLDLILPTIRSRCQTIRLAKLPFDFVKNELIQKKGISQEQAESLAFIADGNMSKAFRLVEMKQDNALLFFQWLRSSFKGNGLELYQWVDQNAGAGRAALKQLLLYGIQFLQALMHYQLDSEIAIRLTEQEKSTMVNMSRIYDLQDCMKMVTWLNEGVEQVERNINSKLILMDTALRIHGLKANT